MSVHYVPAKAGGRAPTPDILGAVLTGEEQNVTETAEIMSGLAWDYTQAGDNAEAVIEHTVELKRSERRASEAIIETGRHLLAVQELMPHGTWLDWLAVEFKMSKSTAYNMIGIAKRFDGKLPTVGNLTPSVLYLLAGDSVPEEAREEVIQRAAAGETVTKAVAKAVIEEYRPVVQPKPLTQEQLDEFFVWYWSGTNLQAVANNPSPLASLRSIIERGAIGSTNRVWRYEIRNGYIRVWHVQNGNMFDRGPDEAWLLHDFARMSAKYLPEPTINTAAAPVVVDVVDGMDAEPETDEADERPVTPAMRAAQRAIWNWLADQCGAAAFKEIVDLAEALHFQESTHPLWFRMYPQGADIDDVFWALEACIDQAAAAVPEYAQQTAAFVPTANLKAAVIYWLREAYPDYYGQVAALECMIADPMHDEDVQRMEPTLPAPYRKDDLLVAMMQASAYLDSLKDDEPEKGENGQRSTVNGQWSMGEGEPAPVLFVDDSDLSKLAKASYSGDTLTGYGKPPYLRGMFEYDGRRWVAVVGNGTSVRVHELDEEIAPGETVRGIVKDAYKGREATYRGKKYRLGAQWLVVTRSDNPLLSDGGEEEEHPLSNPTGPAAQRMNRLHTVKVRFQETIDLLPKFGDLTGHFVDTNPAKRALQELIGVLDNEMDALTRSVKGGAEE